MFYSHLPFYFMNVVIHSCVYAFIVLAIFKSKLRYKKSKTIMLVSLWIIFTVIFDFLFFEIEAVFPSLKMQMSFMWVAISVGFISVTIKNNKSQLCFVILVLLGFQNNMMMCARLMYIVKPFPVIFQNFEEFNYLLYSVLILIAVLPFFWYLFGKLFKKIIDIKIDLFQWKFIFILPLLYFSYCEVSAFGGINLLNPELEDFLLLLLLNSFAYFSYVAVLKMLLNSYDNYKINEQMNLISCQLEMQKIQYEKMAKSIEKTSRLRHDWRHHLLLIKKYAENGDIENINDYLEKYFDEYTIETDAPICQNHSVDVILRHYLALAKEENIDVTTSVNIPASLNVSDQHLCIVFGNLMENAVEACMKQMEGKRFINIKAKPVGDQLVCIIQNSYSGKILKLNDDFLSTKHDGYGIGISSAKSIAESTGGGMSLTYTQTVFKVSILLNS